MGSVFAFLEKVEVEGHRDVNSRGSLGLGGLVRGKGTKVFSSDALTGRRAGVHSRNLGKSQRTFLFQNI